MSKESAPLVVEAVGLQKTFYDFWRRPKAHAVNGINFSVRQGQVLGFLGPNGSGKSTTVKMMLGLLRPTSGTMKVFERSPSHVNTKARIGYLPEETYLYNYLTGEETLDFFGSLFNLSAAQRKKRTEELLRMVGMQATAKRPVGEYSKGMARRIGVAQALINDPDLVILDEPTSGLDPIGCREIKDIIKTLARRGKTVILCSHLLADVQDVCDDVLIMYGGKIRAQGPLEELLSVQEKTQLTFPRLAPELLQRILDMVAENVPEAETLVDNPTMTLESFFMDVVNKARQEHASTSGVDETGVMASFLENDESESSQATANIINALKEQPAAQPEPMEELIEADPEDKPDLEMLSELSQEEPEEPEVEPNEATTEDKAQASQAINDILKRKF